MANKRCTLYEFVQTLSLFCLVPGLKPKHLFLSKIQVQPIMFLLLSFLISPHAGKWVPAPNFVSRQEGRKMLRSCLLMAMRWTLRIGGPETYIPTELVETHLMPQHFGLGIFSEPVVKLQNYLRGIESLDASETQHVSWGNERTELEKRLYFCKGAARMKHNPIPRERKASLFFPLLLRRASLCKCPQPDSLGGILTITKHSQDRSAWQSSTEDYNPCDFEWGVKPFLHLDAKCFRLHFKEWGQVFLRNVCINSLSLGIDEMAEGPLAWVRSPGFESEICDGDLLTTFQM